MSDIKNNVHNINELEEKRMLDAYMESGERRLRQALAETPDTEAPQDAFDRYAHGAKVETLPVDASAARATGELAAGHTAQVIQFKGGK